MGYKKDTLAKANDIISKRRSNAHNIQTARKTEISAKIPEIEKYETQLSTTGLAVVKALGMGKDSENYINELSNVNLAIQQAIKNKLTENGYPEDYLEAPYTCKKCGDTGFIDGYVCECRKELLKKISADELASVSQSRKCSFENFTTEYYPTSPEPPFPVSPRKRMEQILDYCKCYAEDFDNESESLYFYGATGLGKTHLSLAIANVVVEKGYNVIYDSAHNIFSALENEKFSYSNSGEKEKEILECDLLIIDDLGSEFSTNFTVSALYNIVNTRLNRSKPVIISTNLTEEELEAKYTQRLTSRIVGNYTSMLFLGKDIRQIRNS